MGYWTDRDQDGPPKSAEGWHRYEAVKVMRGTESRNFQSKAGDPQLLVILKDEEGSEASTMFTLSDKASWVLARFLARAGVDLGEMDGSNVGLGDLEDETVAGRWIVGLKVWANCAHESGQDGKTYTKLNFFHEHEVPGGALSRGRSQGGDPEPADSGGADSFDDGSPVPDDDDIPF
jgi:hypothetical protein